VLIGGNEYRLLIITELKNRLQEKIDKLENEIDVFEKVMH
jgi:hypothetical protein